MYWSSKLVAPSVIWTNPGVSQKKVLPASQFPCNKKSPWQSEASKCSGEQNRTADLRVMNPTL